MCFSRCGLLSSLASRKRCVSTPLENPGVAVTMYVQSLSVKAVSQHQFHATSHMLSLKVGEGRGTINGSHRIDREFWRDNARIWFSQKVGISLTHTSPALERSASDPDASPHQQGLLFVQ